MAIFNSLTFDNINSLDKGVYITGSAVYDAPERIVDMISIPGRNGNLAIDQGHFENIEVTYPAGCFADDPIEFAEKVGEFRNILAARYSYKRLTDDYNPGEYRLGLYKSGLSVSPVSFNRAGEFNITFECKPQRWLVSGEVTETFTATGTIENPTDFPARPMLVVTGAGILTVGDQTLTIVDGSGANQVIYIDCESMEAWEVVGQGKISRNDYIQNAGQAFPVLDGGENGIILGTGITKVEITPRWWRI